MRLLKILVLGSLITILASGVAFATESDITADLQKDLSESMEILKNIQQNLKDGNDASQGIARLSALAEDVRVLKLLLEERFKGQLEKIKSISPDAALRQEAMQENFNEIISSYLKLTNDLVENPSPATALELTSLLEKALHRANLPIYGATPYTHMSFPPVSPVTYPAITPAYLGGEQEVRPQDTADTEFAPINKEIAELAESLSWNPERIYAWMVNNIKTEWYYGAMKGALETLRQGSGNDCDQAALLVALYRASGFPARYVKGVIEFYPDLEFVQNITGINDPREIEAFFRKAGIPVKPVVKGGQISNFRIEHVWVEARIPYGNYRGAMVDDHDKTWLGLDSSIKFAGFTHPDMNFLASAEFGSLANEYLADPLGLEPLEWARKRLSSSLSHGVDYTSAVSPPVQNIKNLDILPASLQFKTISVTGEYEDLPEELLHKVKFSARDTDENLLFEKELFAYTLSNQEISVAYEPETVEDQEIINSWGGLSNTPGYLIRLRPVLRLEDETLMAAADGLESGRDFSLSMEIIAPAGKAKSINQLTCGGTAVINIISQKPLDLEEIPLEEKDGVRLLREAGLDHIREMNKAEDELSLFLDLALCRPMPTILTTGCVVTVKWLLGIPHGVTWKGVYVDADFRAVELAGQSQSRQKTFMELCSLIGSDLEAQVLVEAFGVGAISTADLMIQAREQGIPLLTINSTNIDTLLPGLMAADNIKDDITNSISRGMTVTIPIMEISHNDWTGTGYIKQNPVTGESGWMLTGLIAGGMSTWGADLWFTGYQEKLIDIFVEGVNTNPEEAFYLAKVPKTDNQEGFVGEKLEFDLQVKVYDKYLHPVKGAEVFFEVKAGGGTLKNHAGEDSAYAKAVTDYNGIASVPFTLGKYTASNPAYIREPGMKYSQQVGSNLVLASLKNRSSMASSFKAIGKPLPNMPEENKSWQMAKAYGEGSTILTLSWGGFISLTMGDFYGNPIANAKVDFLSMPVEDIYYCYTYHNPNPLLLVDPDAPCMDNIPVYGECGSTAVQVETHSNGSAFVQFIMGSPPDSTFPVKASCENVGYTIFRLYSTGFSIHCCNHSPETEFRCVSKGVSDPFGNTIEAARVTKFIPVIARVTTLTGPLGENCEFRLDYVNNATVTLGGFNLEHDFDGIYRLNKYPVGDTPFSGLVTMRAEAMIDDDEEIDFLDKYIHAVDFKTPEEIRVHINKYGFSLADVPLDYTIQTSHYKAMNACVRIYRDGVKWASIPSHRQSAGSEKDPRGIIAKNTWFDESSVYKAQVVLNPGTGVEILSDKFPVNLYDNCGMEGIGIVNDAYPVLPGEMAQAYVRPKKAWNVLWEIIAREPLDKSQPVKAEIDPVTGWIRADEDSGSGWITIRATNNDENECVVKAKLYIGCPECTLAANSSCEDRPGTCFLDLGSIDVRFNIGRAVGGKSAGNIILSADAPSLDLVSPEALDFSTLAEGVRAIYGEDSALRQVMAPQTFVDIVRVNDFACDINFYFPGQATGPVDGLYQLIQGATPFRSWRIENPDASKDSYNRLVLTETVEGQNPGVFEYVWDKAASTWTLIQGQGLSIKEMTEGLDSATGDTVISEKIKDGEGNLAASTQTWLRPFSWGKSPVRYIVDPDGASLATLTSYYEDPGQTGSYGRVKSRVNPDGSWTIYEYDSAGRRTAVITPWLNSPMGVGPESARATYYSYSPVDVDDAVAPQDEYSPRMVTETVLGVVTGKTFYAYLVDLDGTRTEITERAASQSANYGDSENPCSVLTYYPSGTLEANSGK